MRQYALEAFVAPILMTHIKDYGFQEMPVALLMQKQRQNHNVARASGAITEQQIVNALRDMPGVTVTEKGGAYYVTDYSPPQQQQGMSR